MDSYLHLIGGELTFTPGSHVMNEFPNPLVSLLDFGFGILDGATVEAAALVMRGGAL